MDEQDGFEDNGNNQAGPIINKNPYLLVSLYSSVISYLESYGWFILFGIVFFMVIWTNIREPLKRFFGQRKRDIDVTDYMTPDQVESRMRAMDAARQQMQEKYDKLVQERAEKRQQQEEEKRQRLIDDHEALKHGKSQSGTLHKMDFKSSTESTSTVIKRNKDAKPMRSDDFNPLSGSSSSSRYRPAPRPARSGG